MNADKCKLLVTNQEVDIAATVDGYMVKADKSVKLLSIRIDNKLDFHMHVSNICKKSSLIIHALARISQFMNNDRLRIVMRALILSQFGYCPLIWMFHSRTLNNKINTLHEQALRLVYQDNNLTFEELLHKDGSFTIHQRNIQKLATEMYKIKHYFSPSFMNSIFPFSG